MARRSPKKHELRATGTRERGKAERRRRILETAEALVRRDGEVAFSMRTLADRAGLSLATPFNLFGSKGAILDALVERSIDEQLERLDATRDPNPIERVLALGDRAVCAYTDDDELYRPLLDAVVRSGQSANGLGLLRRCTELWREALRDTEAAGLLDPDLDLDLLARQLHLEYRAGMTLWLSGETNDEGWRLQVQHGVALVLLAAAAAGARDALRRRLTTIQKEIAALPAQGVISLGARGSRLRQKEERA